MILILSKEAYCKLIKTKRKYANTHYKRKVLQGKIVEFFDATLKFDTRWRLDLGYNISTGKCGLVHGLRYGRIIIHPSKHGKQNCNDVKLLEIASDNNNRSTRKHYKTHKRQHIEYSNNTYRRKNVSVYIDLIEGRKLNMRLNVSVNINTGHIGLHSYLRWNQAMFS